MKLFVYTSHLWQEDRELGHHDDAFLAARRRSTDDVLRDLDRHGIDTDAVEDAFARATVELAFRATADGELTVPAGTLLSNADSAIRHAGVRFATDADLVVSPGQEVTVDATAVDPGTPGNVDAGELAYLVDDGPANFDTVTHFEPASGGQDHQMTRAATYRAMEMIYLDLMRTADDAFAARRKVYRKLYRDEIDRTIAAGVRLDENDDGDAETKTHGLKRFRRS